MTTLIDRVVGVAGVSVFIYLSVGGIFYYAPDITHAYFQILSLLRAVENPVKLRTLHKTCRDIFSKIGISNVRGITKNVPNLQVP